MPPESQGNLETKITVGGIDVPLRVAKGRKGRVRMLFKETTLTVETATGSLQADDWRFIESKSLWIRKNYLKLHAHYSQRGSFLQNIENEALIFGRKTPVSFRPAVALRYDLIDSEGLIVSVPPKYEKVERKRLIVNGLRSLADSYLKHRTAEWAAHTQSAVNRLTVKDHRSKWGSCSSKRNINLNWHLILLDKRAIDYVIVHELMHLREMNHSPRFWAHVAAYLPDYKKIIKYTRDNQWLIGIYD